MVVVVVVVVVVLAMGRALQPINEYLYVSDGSSNESRHNICAGSTCYVCVDKNPAGGCTT